MRQETLTLSRAELKKVVVVEKIISQRHRKKAHQPRQRRAQAEALWQIDATPYAWLEDRAPNFALHAAIDD